MLKNHLLITLRNLYRRKLYTLINVLGLTIGISSFLLLALYVVDELNFDKFHDNKDSIYRIVERKIDDGTDRQIAAVSFRLSQDVVREIPEVRDATLFFYSGRTVVKNEENNREFYTGLLWTNQSFFQMFDFGLAQGDVATCLTKPNTALLSPEYADKLFPNQNPVGKQLTTDRGFDFTVTGVLEPVPGNSHLQFDVLFSMETMRNLSFYERVQNDWTSNSWLTYLHLEDNSDPGLVAGKLTNIVDDHREVTDNSRFELQALSDIHFNSAEIEGTIDHARGNLSYVYVFSIIGLFILLLACINYINLATASSENYSRETGVRKVLGAGKHSIFRRYLLESGVTTLIALFLAVNLVNLLMPAFNAFTGKDLSLFSNGQVLLLLLGVMILVTLVSGSYPSLYLARFKPADVLKTGFVRLRGGQINLRKGLVIFQFVISTVMIIATITAFRQMDFISTKDLGFQKDNLVIVDINSGMVRQGFQTIKDGYAALPEVKAVSVSSRVPGEWKVIPQVSCYTASGSDPLRRTPYFLAVDEDFLSAFEMELLEGRNFDASRPGDTAAVILNEAAARILEIENPEDQIITIESRVWEGNEVTLDEPLQVRVIGIVEDFHFQSLHEPIRPLLLLHRTTPIHSIDYFSVRFTPSQTEQTIRQLTDILHAVDPAHIFEYHFLDEQLANFYETDLKRSKIFSFAAILAILISCLGMLGLASFTIAKRTKEIGIRKVLGASVVDIVGLFSRDFAGLVLVASIVAIPIAFFTMRGWLQDFTYHISLSWWIFIAGAALALLIAVLTIGVQCVRAASSDPVDSLRYE